MNNFKTEAIVLKAIKFAEADRLLTVFSRHYGRVKVLAKGIRKVTSRKGASLELFNRTKLVLAKGRNLDIITEVEVLDAYRNWRQDLVRVGVAYYLVELVERLIPEGEENRRVYRLLVNSLENLSQARIGDLIRRFEEEMLTDSGFGIPENYRDNAASLSAYIEEIIERNLKSKDILKLIKYA
ncbi:MAG: DNA repair protein RecO [Candidatus Pacebacteria bacterium]|nr:DNA repair protein RecO [Candidatus Paceibacterota bacterium]